MIKNLFGLAFFLTWSQFTLFAQITTSAGQGCAPLPVTFSSSQQFQNYTWNFSNGAQSNAAQPTIVFSNEGVYAVTLTVSNQNEGSQSFILNNAVTVAVPTIPSMTVSSDTICLGESINLEVQNPTPGSSYFWNLSDGNSASTSSISHVYEYAGNYLVSLQETNASGCVSSLVTQLITVLAKPNTNIALSSNLLCSQNDSSTASAPPGMANYAWMLNGVLLSGAQSITLQNLTNGEHELVLSVLSSSGCTAHDTAIITSTNPQSPEFSISDTMGCAPLSVTLEASSVGLQQISWSAGGLSASGQTAHITFEQDGNFELNYTAQDSAGCLLSDTLAVISVLPSPQTNLNFIDTVVCDSALITFTNYDPLVVQTDWTINGQLLSGTTVQYHFNQPGNYGIQVNSQYANGCAQQLNLENAVKIENARPGIEINPWVGCGSHSINLLHENPDLIASTWVIEYDTTVGESLIHSFDSIGTYDITFIGESDAGCTDTLEFENLVTIIEGSLAWNAPVVKACNGTTITFDAEILGVTDPVWNFGDGSFSSDSIVSHSFLNPGEYVVSLQGRDLNGCEINLDTHTIAQIGTPEPAFSYDITNCENAEVTVSSTTSGADQVKWIFGDTVLFDSVITLNLTGKRYWSFTMETTGSNGCVGVANFINAIDLDTCFDVLEVSGEYATSGSGIYSQTKPYKACAPASVDFNHPLDSASFLIFDFGDGDTAHTSGFVSHTYDTVGLYDVTIYAVNSILDTDTIVLQQFIEVGQPIAGFDIGIINRCHETMVEIENQSLNASIWYTSFGDGFTSNAFEPAHGYDSIAFYTIAMRATDTIGCSATSFRTIAANNPSVQFSAPAVVCFGDSTFINHSIDHFSQYIWHVNNQSFVGQNAMLHFTQSGQANVWLEAKDDMGCSSTFFEGTQIEVAQPIAEIEWPSTAIFCDSIDTVLINSSSGADNFRWYLNGDFVSTSNDFQVQSNDAGDFVVMLKARKNACESAISDTLSVKQALADFAINVSDSCLPATINFTDLSENPVSWEWSFGNGLGSTVQQPQFQMTQPSNDEFTLRIVDNDGCVGLKSIEALDMLHVGVIASDYTLCYPAAPVLSDTVAMASQYVWYFGNTPIFGNNTAQFVMQDTGYVNVTLDAIHSSGCTTSVSLDSFIYVAKPDATFELDSTLGSCAPMLAHFTPKRPAHIAAYHWDFGDGTFSCVSHPYNLYETPGQFAVQLVVEDVYGCVDSAYADSLVSTLGPVAGFMPTQDKVCMNDSVHFENKSLDYSTSFWSFGDGHVSTQDEPSHVFEQHGEHEIILIAIDGNGCQSSKILPAYQVMAKPKLDFEIMQDSTCTPVQLTLIDKSANLQHPVYTLRVGDSSFSILPDEPVYYTIPGTHAMSLHVSNDNGCGSDSVLVERLVVFDTNIRGEVLLTELWQSSSEVEVTYLTPDAPNYLGAELYHNTGNIWSMIHESKLNQITYRDENVNNSSQTCFKLIPSYECVGTKKLAHIKPHCSIELSVSKGEHMRLLTWTPLENVTFDGYELLYAPEGSDKWKKLTNTSGEETSYLDETHLCPGNVNYVIHALNLSGQGQNANSKHAMVTVDTLPFLNNHLNVKLVTILDDGAALVEWENGFGSSPLVEFMTLQRKNQRGELENILVDKRSSHYIDQDVNSDSSVYVYSVAAKNICDIMQPQGLNGNSILLLREQDGSVVKLKWNPYEMWDGKLKYYEVQIQDEFGNWQTIERIEPERLQTELNLLEID